MKKTDLRKIIKEELAIILKEEPSGLFNDQRVLIELKRAIVNIVKKYKHISPQKNNDPRLSSLDDVIGHSALNIVKYLNGSNYIV